MKAIDFKERNIILAKNQPQYHDLPIQFNDDAPGMPATACYEMSDPEKAVFAKTNRLYIQQLTFQEPIPLADQPETTFGYHPISVWVCNPWRAIDVPYERTIVKTVIAFIPLVDNTFKEVHGKDFTECLDKIISEFPELEAENINFVPKDVPEILNNIN